MTIRRAWLLCLWGFLSTAAAGCSFFIALDEVDHGASTDGGVGGGADAEAKPDVSAGTPDVMTGVEDARPVDASLDLGTVGNARSDASVGNDAAGLSDVALSDAGTCSNPMYPVACPGHGSPLDGGVPAGCWTANTDCTTVTNCGGTYHGCLASHVYDCATNRCVLVCTDPMYPVMCPAVGTPDAGGTTAGCWTSGTDCSTVMNCAGMEHACRTGYRYDCAASQCISTSDAGDAAPPPACDGGQTNCGGRCVDLRTSSSNCGTCGHACTSGQQCSTGQCCMPSDAGGACQLPACGCAAGNVCYPDTPATGLQCFVSAGLTEGADCTGSGAICASGLGCFGGTCRRYCSSNADCPLVDGARLCEQTIWSDSSGPIPGVLVCRRICDPVSPQNPRSPLLACPAGFGCFADQAPGASTCITGGTGLVGDTGAGQSDCAPGYYCSAGNSCNRYCFTSNDCAPGSSCFSFSPSIFGGSHEVGFCFSSGGFDGGILD